MMKAVDCIDDPEESAEDEHCGDSDDCFPGAAMVGDDRDIRNRVAHVVAQLRQISEGSGRINARDTWLTFTLAIAELESLLTILRKRLP